MRRLLDRARITDTPALVLLVLWSVLLLTVVLIRARTHGYYFDGADSRSARDQLQYLAWVRESGLHGLVSDRFDTAPSGHVFLHPMFLLSGSLWRLGLSLQLAYLLWKPVAVVALFFGVRAYAARLVPEGWGRRATVLLALFFYTPILPLLYLTKLGGLRAHEEIGFLSVETFAAGNLWGYLPGAIAIGLVPLGLLALERALDPARRAPARGPWWYSGWAAAAGASASWLHPWQGETLLLVMAGSAAWQLRTILRARAAALVAVPLIATTLPLAYYFLLGHLDPGWEAARRQSVLGQYQVWVLLLGLAPLAVPAALGLRSGRPLDLQDKAVRLWIPAAIVVYYTNPTSATHGLWGISIPLAVLAVRGWHRLAPKLRAGWRPAAAVTACVILTGSTVIFAVRSANIVNTRPNLLGPLLPADQAAAFSYLRRNPLPGAVVSAAAPGAAIPALTGRAVWVGHYTWTPDFDPRSGAIERVLDNVAIPAVARATLEQSRARFLLTDCDHPRLDARRLAPLITGVRRFGPCYAVYTLRPARA